MPALQIFFVLFFAYFAALFFLRARRMDRRLPWSEYSVREAYAFSAVQVSFLVVGVLDLLGIGGWPRWIVGGLGITIAGYAIWCMSKVQRMQIADAKRWLSGCSFNGSAPL